MTDRRLPRGLGRVLPAVAVRPDLWPTAVSSLWRLRPLPGRRAEAMRYLRFRFVTLNGGTEAPGPAETVRFLEWVQEFDRAARLTRSRRRYR